MHQRTKLFGMGAILLIAVGVAGQGGFVGWTQSCSVTLVADQSITAAINNIPEGGTICLGEGTFNESIKIMKNLTLKGQGPQKTVIKAREGIDGKAIQITDAVEVYLEGFQIIGAFGTQEGVLVTDRAKATLLNIGISKTEYAVHAMGSVQVTASNSRFSDGSRGFYVIDGAQVTVSNSEISKSEDGFFISTSANVKIANSQIVGNRRSGIFVWLSASVEISHNTIQNNGFCGAEVSHREAQVQGTSNDMINNGADLCGYAPASLRKPLVPQTSRAHLDVPQDYENLQEAIDAVALNGTISISPGHYKTGVTIWKPLTIQGAGSDQTVLQALQRHPIALSISGDANEVILVNLQVSESPIGMYVYGEATLQNVEVSRNEAGMFVIEPAQLTLRNSSVSENNSIGIWIEGQSTINLDHSQISSNGSGIFATRFANVNLVDSSVFSNHSAAITAYFDTVVNVKNSSIYENERGFHVSGKTKLTLVDSQVYANLSVGLNLFESAKVTLQNSSIGGNGTLPSCTQAGPAYHYEGKICNGISLWEKAQLTVIDSTFIENTDWGIAAVRKECGYIEDPNTGFSGSVIFQGTNTFDGNSKSGNQNGMGNPGNHPFKNLPDGQVCLP